MFPRNSVFMILMIAQCSAEESNETEENYTDPVYVNTECGRFRGMLKSTQFGGAEEYVQIPYAVPPVGNLRWKHSKLLTPGSHERCRNMPTDIPEVTSTIKCVQSWNGKQVEGQEDCLYLSVRTPRDRPTKLPVLVWMHGGGLLSGWSDQPGYSPSPELTVELGVVTVNINYRLDVFGFMSLPELWKDGESYGNFGIGDAITALRWVQRNIESFGGDPNSVTILGESSGANLVLGILAAPSAEGLFHKAIALSGSPKWNSTYEDAHRRRAGYIERVGCAKGNRKDRRDCLKAADVKTLIENRDLNRGYGYFDFPYALGQIGECMDYTVMEPTIVPFSPEDMHRDMNWRRKRKAYSKRNVKGKKKTKSRLDVKRVKVILSNTAQENGYNTFGYGYNHISDWDTAQQFLKGRIEIFGRETGQQTRSNLQNKIERRYNFGENNNTWWPQMYWDTLTTDIRATCPFNELTKSMNKIRDYDVYRMYISHYPDVTVDGFRFESIHGWDTEALFGYKLYGLTDEQQRAPHQYKFQQNLKKVVAKVCHDSEIQGWDTTKTLHFNNKDEMKVEKNMPQDKVCRFWARQGLDGYGGQN